MKFSVSTYSLSGLVGKDGVTEKDLIKIAKEIGFEGIEFAEIHMPENHDKIEYAKELNEECKKHGIIPVQYSIGADFIYGSDGDIEKEIDRLKYEVDVAAALGVTGMRHDCTGGFRDQDAKTNGFNEALPLIIKGCKAVTEYAKTKGIRTMMENHGYFCQDSDRVEKIVTGVNDSNFGLLLDMGNFLCADENPVVAFGKLKKYASFVHAKDFHIKSGDNIAPTDGFFTTRGGTHLRGAVLGHGNVPVFQCLSTVINAGYDYFITLEFEGCEEPRMACEWGLNTLKKYISLI
ncbi:MAG: sugar phosphate isomerase/epimerase [Clostridia bacterium]|nr:sugar phosphate isomerase/epimerase [Clostridia bacterium]